jgi:hypothetical protein
MSCCIRSGSGVLVFVFQMDCQNITIAQAGEYLYLFFALTSKCGSVYLNYAHYIYIGCFKKSFTTLKAYRNLYRGHTQCFELSKYSRTHRVLPWIVIRNCFKLFFRFLIYGTSTVTPTPRFNGPYRSHNDHYAHD